MSTDLVEAAFRAKMSALARQGGAATRRRLAKDPSYYRDIGRLGGLASVATIKARMAKSLGQEIDDRATEPISVATPAPVEIELIIQPTQQYPTFAAQILANLNRRRR